MFGLREEAGKGKKMRERERENKTLTKYVQFKCAL